MIPSLTQLEGNPFDRPVYHYVQPAGVQGIFKKGMNPKAQNILADLLGKQAADQYVEDFKNNQESEQGDNEKEEVVEEKKE